jgi:hypothetical protein
VARRKPRQTTTGRLQSLRLFSTLLAISNNVGGVKFFSSVGTRALRGARHFALVEEVPFPTQARSQSFQVRNSVRPIHLFGRIRDP